MVFRTLDENNDWTFGKGLNDFVKENAEVALDIKTRLKEWVNDCFFNLPAGIDWANRLGNFNQRSLLEQDIKTVILQTSGVSELLNFSSSFDNVERKLIANYTVRTIYSSTFEDIITQII